MELRHLRYFIAVAEEMNMHRAAARLHISQPPLSLTVKQLEGELGVKLFHRKGRGLGLTRAGGVYLAHARKILADAKSAEESVRQSHLGMAGHLKIGFISSAVTGILQKTISAFRQKYPAVVIDIHQATNGYIPQQLLDKKIDIGILRLPEKIPDALNIKEIVRESWYVALPQNHVLIGRDSISFKDLDGVRLIFYPRWNNPAGYDDVMSMFREKKIEPLIYQEAPEQMTIAGLVASGMGVGIVPECMAKIAVPGVTHRPIKGTRNRTGFAIVTRREDDVLVQNFLKIS